MEIDNPAAFDKDEQAILAAIVPEESTVEEGQAAQPVEAPAPAAQPAAAEAPKAEEAPSAIAPEPEQQPAASQAPAPTEQPRGDTRAALRAARHDAKRARDEAERLRQELEAFKAGKAPVDNSITDAELAELERDFPAQAKIARQQRELQEQLARLAPQPAQNEFEPVTFDFPEIQEAIDAVPDLLAWQYDPQAQDKFERAQAYDRALQNDPDWAGKSLQERFAEAAERTKRAFAPATTSATPSAAPAAAPRNDPAQVIEQAPVEGPKGISDFRGGAPGNAPSLDYRRMTDEQIMASLPVA